ncbi:SRPBCC family protein [Microbacterium sp. ZW T5_56]|uniref:SRPBCC family protein n=1 Tax=Microbacterium sp. ZW T5_56 TaxID=3378081 RepID=UPI0038552A3A
MRVLSTHHRHTPHPPSAVYRLWASPREWVRWDPDVADVRFTGESREGARGWMRPATGPATSFTITEVDPDRLLTTTSRLPGAVLCFRHEVEPEGAGSRASVTIGVSGPLRALWAILLRRNFAPAAERNLEGLLTQVGAA